MIIELELEVYKDIYNPIINVQFAVEKYNYDIKKLSCTDLLRIGKLDFKIDNKIFVPEKNQYILKIIKTPYIEIEIWNYDSYKKQLIQEGFELLTDDSEIYELLKPEPKQDGKISKLLKRLLR